MRLRCHTDLAHTQEIALDIQAPDGLFDLIQVFHPQGKQCGEFLRPAAQTVLDPMRDRCVHEAAVAAAGAAGNFPGFEQDDIPGRIFLLCQERGP